MSSATDERLAPAGSAGRRRRRGSRAYPQTQMRLHPTIAALLERDAKTSNQSKAAIVEELLRRRYRIPKGELT